ncbi:MAG: protease inhibitor I42 family protein [Henriciella sp.]
MRFARLIVIAPLLFMAGCVADVLNTKPEVRGLEGAAPVQTLYEPDEKSEATLRVGGALIVQLASNPTTGYFWQQTAGDTSIVRPVSDEYTADPAPEGLTGSGGMQMFRFEGALKGKTTVILAYQRSPSDVFEQREIAVKVIE